MEIPKRWVYLFSTTTKNSESKGSKVAIRHGDTGTEEASICLNNGELTCRKVWPPFPQSSQECLICFLPPLDVEVQMPPGMETDPLPLLFRALEHLKAKVLGAQFLASSLLVHSQNQTGWDVFPAGLCLPQGWERKEPAAGCCLLRVFDFLGRFWSYFLSQGDHREAWGLGHSSGPSHTSPLQILGD